MRLVCVPENQFLLTIFFIIKGIYGFLSIIIYLLNVTVMYKGRNKFNKTFRWLYTTAALLVGFLYQGSARRNMPKCCFKRSKSKCHWRLECDWHNVV